MTFATFSYKPLKVRSGTGINIFALVLDLLDVQGLLCILVKATDGVSQHFYVQNLRELDISRLYGTTLRS